MRTEWWTAWGVAGLLVRSEGGCRVSTSVRRLTAEEPPLFTCAFTPLLSCLLVALATAVLRVRAACCVVLSRPALSRAAARRSVATDVPPPPPGMEEAGACKRPLPESAPESAKRVRAECRKLLAAATSLTLPAAAQQASAGDVLLQRLDGDLPQVRLSLKDKAAQVHITEDGLGAQSSKVRRPRHAVQTPLCVPPPP